MDLADTAAVESALRAAPAVLNCAGPFAYTFAPLVQACLRTQVHYMDLTGEMPVYEAIAARDASATARGVMLLPGAGFDVVPTDCLAVHLKNRLSTADRLTLALCSDGPAGLPPGTQRTVIELMPFGKRVRRNGKLIVPKESIKTRLVDFGRGPVQVIRLTWGDVFTAYFSTGIPNIEDYVLFSPNLRRQLAWIGVLRPIFRWKVARDFLKRSVKPGATQQECEQTSMHVWGEVQDAQGKTARARVHGPEAGRIWTSRSAIAAVRRVLAGKAVPGFQTPAKAFGPDFLFDCEGVTREDIA